MKCNNYLFEDISFGVSHSPKEVTDLLSSKYCELISKAGAIQEQEVKICSGIDPTVRFIGSHISVLKPYLRNENLPNQGVYLVQPCVRTHGAKNLTSFDSIPNWGSFFVSWGALFPYSRTNDLVVVLLNFLQEALCLPMSQIYARVASKDLDLMTVVSDNFLQENIEVDTMHAGYYVHKIGMDDVKGRNFNIAIEHKVSKKIEDIGNIIVIEKDGEPYAVELAIGASTTMKQVFGLGNVLDCHYFNDLVTTPDVKERKLQDCVLTSSYIIREGVLPSSKNNRTRILKKYVDSMYFISRDIGFSDDDLLEYVQSFLNKEFPTQNVSFILDTIAGHSC
tara:strand:- start:15227 stop:16234 length:1008 start_codon:yes stop_codon:yes gene_type:complete